MLHEVSQNWQNLTSASLVWEAAAEEEEEAEVLPCSASTTRWHALHRIGFQIIFLDLYENTETLYLNKSLLFCSSVICEAADTNTETASTLSTADCTYRSSPTST